MVITTAETPLAGIPPCPVTWNGYVVPAANGPVIPMLLRESTILAGVSGTYSPAAAEVAALACGDAAGNRYSACASNASSATTITERAERRRPGVANASTNTREPANR